MHVDLIDLRLFVNIVQAGNITAGASLSHLSLPAASARIRAIEASLGVELLQRSRRGISPTPAGQALAQHARLLLQQVERMNHDLSEYAQGFKGRGVCCAIPPHSLNTCPNCWPTLCTNTLTSVSISKS